MKVTPTDIPDVLIVEPRLRRRARLFFESWNRRTSRRGRARRRLLCRTTTAPSRGVLRGLHYRSITRRGKLVRVIAGEVYDVAVDLRRASPTFGRHVAVTLSADNARMLWVPAGFAHGFCVTSDSADFLYKTTDYWHAEHERTLLWNDPALGIDWPVGEPVIAAKDAAGTPLARAETYA
jgi:dTDP-4-dehydrorhamnose 3,5-epimerase